MNSSKTGKLPNNFSCPPGGVAPGESEKDMEIKHAIHCQRVYTDETVCEECNLYSECTHETQADIARLAISALEKQIPMSPITYKETNRADCPVCGATVRGINKPFGDWCAKCGQKLDWSK